MMKSFLSTLFFFAFRGHMMLGLCIVFATGFQKIKGQALENDSLKIVLIIGQSNMAGRAEILPEDQKIIPQVSLLNDQGQWIPAENPLNKYSSVRKKIEMQRLGPGYAFAKKLSQSKKYQPLGLVVNAKGGTPIEEWMPGAALYNEAVRRTKLALANGKLIGVLWHQGEGDSQNPDHYLSDIKILIESLRKDFGEPKLIFIAGQLSEDKPHRKTFNELILQLPDVVPYTGVVTSKGLKTFDETHFDTKSQHKLGKRYARELKKLLKEHL